MNRSSEKRRDPVTQTRLCVALLAAMVAVSGCTTTSLSKTSVGAAAGAATGGLIGNKAASGNGKVAATIIGAMAGGLVGGAVGAGLDESERRSALEAEYRALEHTPSGQPVPWTGKDAGRRGEVVAAQPYRVGSQDCRQYTQTVSIGNQPRTARGTACRNPDGSWTPLT